MHDIDYRQRRATFATALSRYEARHPGVRGAYVGRHLSYDACVCDSVDTSMKKTATYLPGSPDFGQTLNAFWDAAVTAIKAAEGIV